MRGMKWVLRHLPRNVNRIRVVSDCIFSDRLLTNRILSDRNLNNRILSDFFFEKCSSGASNQMQTQPEVLRVPWS